jgi:MoxR-like ATPase
MKPPRHVPDDARRTFDGIISECQEVVVGKVDIIEDLLIALLSEGHILLEGVPGVAKTTLAKTFSSVLGLSFKRIQGSADIMPADIVGTHVFDQKTGSFKLEKGPVFSNLLLIDEINRNTPKTNSAILEAMQEKQVTIEGEMQPLPSPFMVIATQSPIEFHGVFPLPEVLIDRFLLGLRVDYPSTTEEIEVTERVDSTTSIEARRISKSDRVSYLIGLTRDVYVAPQVRSYMVDLVRRTRQFEGISLGASPRASIALMKASRARALIKGRMYVLPDDVKYLTPRVLSHRIVLSPLTQSQETSNGTMIQTLLEQTPIPERKA